MEDSQTQICLHFAVQIIVSKEKDAKNALYRNSVESSHTPFKPHVFNCLIIPLIFFILSHKTVAHRAEQTIRTTASGPGQSLWVGGEVLLKPS